MTMLCMCDRQQATNLQPDNRATKHVMNPSRTIDHSSIDAMCQPIGMDTVPTNSNSDVNMDLYGTSRAVGPPHDDDLKIMGLSSSGSRDKGRGSYKCGRVSDSRP